MMHEQLIEARHRPSRTAIGTVDRHSQSAHVWLRSMTRGIYSSEVEPPAGKGGDLSLTPVNKTRRVATTPPELALIEAAVMRSRRILDFQEDWDGEGGSPFAESTWQRVRDFIMTNSIAFWERTGLQPPVPRVSPAQDGTIDILWKHEGRLLLLNIPEETDNSVSFYGEGPGQESIKGSLDTSNTHRWLLSWLTE